MNNTFNSNTPIRTVDGSYGVSLEGGRTNIEIAAHYSDAGLLREQDRTGLTDRGRNEILQNNSALLYSVGSPYAGASPNIASANGSNLVLKPVYGGTALGSPITYVPVGTAPGTSPAVLGAALAG